ncbi:hypothetical protein [Solihabitans fulvus]|uniref:hypothetical protein n=1 Tax=Solihabitans fulvus TaxID=1892852 RepID=UPI001CB75DCF|nr:hypothetical protein [Solihabitans fulvus]
MSVLTEVRPPTRAGRRADLVVGAGALTLVAAAALVGSWLNHTGRVHIYAGAPPLFGGWLPHVGPGTPLAVVVAALVVARGPELAARLGRVPRISFLLRGAQAPPRRVAPTPPSNTGMGTRARLARRHLDPRSRRKRPTGHALSWRTALGSAYAAAVAWTFALALVDGWQRGLASRLATPDEYLHEVPGIADIGAALRGFAARIPDFQPDSWTVHVAGHPPGALLVFVWLDRVGLGGGGWAAVACVLVGALAAVAVPVTLRAIAAARGVVDPESAARAALPFAVLLPGAVWIGVSADGLFAGVTACGIALLAVGAATTPRGRPGRRWLAACSGGALLGFGVFLSYGLVLLALPALAVLVLTRNWRAALLAGAGALAVVGAFAAAGFWWVDGYHLVVQRYYQGIAAERPYGYWAWANLAALVLATGLAPMAGLRRAVAGLARRRLDPALLPLAVLACAAALAVLLADSSGLSKAEVERIWLPFTVWLIPAAALLPAPGRRRWLAAQAVTALAVNHLVLTNW